MFESLMKKHEESRMIDALRDNLILERRKLKKKNKHPRSIQETSLTPCRGSLGPFNFKEEGR